jgi:predicted aspartyl protease
VLRALLLFFILYTTALTGWCQVPVFTWAAGNTLSGQEVYTQPFENWGQPPIVTVEIGGKKYRFLLDTGAPTVISSHLRIAGKLPRLGTVSVTDALGNSAQTRVVNLPQIRLGTIQISQIPTLVYDAANPIFSQLEVDGILGSNALAGLTVSFSAQHNTIQFAASAGQSNAIAVPMQLTEDIQGTPAVYVSLTGGSPQLFLFDTGFEGLCDLAPDVAKKGSAGNSVAVRFLKTGGGYASMHGSATASTTVQIPYLQIAGATLQNVRASVIGDSRSKIGSALLKLGDVTLDYPAGRFSFQPYGQ